MAITLTINDQRVAAPEGATILEAARGSGIRIPTLCHHPDLTNVGACRMCVVTVEKARGLQTACTTPVFEGMVVHTESPEARDTRRFVLEMLLSDHPNECMICEVNGACELQDLVYEYDVAWPEHTGARHHYEINPDPNPFIFIDRNKCILCGRCVRACAEIQNRDVWAFAQRGFKSKLVAGADQHLLDARCESCGQCVAYCPVGALYDKMSAGQGRAGQITKVRTTCSYCGVGCNFDLNVRDDRIVRVTSAPDAPVNGMRLCVKGRYGYDYVHHLDRLTKPLVRSKWLDLVQLEQRLANGEWRIANERISESASREGHPVAGKRSRRQPAEVQDTQAGHLGSFTDSRFADSPWVEVDWDTALDVVARKFAEIKRENGPSALAVLTSAKCTNEENYLVNKLVRQVLGTNSIDHCARL
jgi:predicted molibdopterin-dependent oxidoreductase YjgC